MRLNGLDHAAVSLAASLLLWSCGLSANQKEATLGFAKAASDFGDTTSKELTKMRDQTIAMNTALFHVPDLPVEYQGGSGPLVPNYIQEERYNRLAGDFSGDWYALFLSGPEQLKAYGDALTAIMNADEKDQIKKSSDNLAATLRGIPGSPLGNISADTISGLSQQLTEFFVAEMRTHAIKQIVFNASDSVATICRYVGENFQTTAPPGRHSLDDFAFRFQTTARVLASSSETAIRLYRQDRLVRSDALGAYVLAKQNLEEVDKVFPAVIASSQKCLAANNGLVEALRDDSLQLADIEAFLQSVREIYKNAKAIGTSSK